jgi:uncharacterized OsmC-like protein
MKNAVTEKTTNGIDVEALKQVIDEVSGDAAKGQARFNVSTTWKGVTMSETRVDSWQLAGEKLPRNFTVRIDEPAELLGSNAAPNPQEMLMAALNACIMVGYVAGCAMKGIEIQELEIRTDGGLDLRGFLGLDPSVKPGYDAINYTVTVKANGTHEDLEEVHRTVMATSPNYWNMANPVRLNSKLVIR